MRRLARLGALVALVGGSAAGLVATPAPVAADCGMGPPPRHAAGYRGIAFIGTVTSSEAGPHHTTVLTVDVERPILGVDSPTLTIVSDTKGCSYFWGSQLKVGDRFLLAFRPVQGMPFELPEGATYADSALAYRPTAEGWRFARGLSLYPDLFPERAQQADTLAEILAFLGAGLPPRDAEPSPLPSPVVTLSARGKAQDDLFRLTIETPGTTFAEGEPIPITTTLTYVGTATSMTVTHAGGNIVAFGIEQLDGPLDAGPARRMICAAQVVSAGDVESVPFSKSGGYAEDDPLAPMWSAWLHDPLVRPPAGTYRIDAIAEYGPAGCAPTISLTASVTIEVVEGSAPSPGAAISVLPPVDAPPEVVLDAYLLALVAGDCTTAHALATDTFTIGGGELCGALTVLSARIDPLEPAHPSSDEVVFVTTLTITGGDASMPDGEQGWFYDLQRQPDGAWRITGGGTGP